MGYSYDPWVRTSTGTCCTACTRVQRSGARVACAWPPHGRAARAVDDAADDAAPREDSVTGARLLTLGDDEAAFRWAVPELCWREYWVDVEYPGLSTWCMPVLRGEEVPSDPPSTPPLRLEQPSTTLHELAGK